MPVKGCPWQKLTSHSSLWSLMHIVQDLWRSRTLGLQLPELPLPMINNCGSCSPKVLELHRFATSILWWAKGSSPGSSSLALPLITILDVWMDELAPIAFAFPSNRLCLCVGSHLMQINMSQDYSVLESGFSQSQCFTFRKQHLHHAGTSTEGRGRGKEFCWSWHCWRKEGFHILTRQVVNFTSRTCTLTRTTEPICAQNNDYLLIEA